jgi:guanylate kinase
MSLKDIWKKFVLETKTNGTIVAIYGPSASGKSVARDIFVDNGWEKIVSYTTRPPRSAAEEEAGEYDFISKDEFDNLLNKGRLINVNLFYADKSYGIDIRKIAESKRAVMITDKSSVFMLKNSLEEMGKKVVLVYVTAPPQELMRRQRARLEKGEYTDPQELEARLKELEKEIKSEIKIKEFADFVIIRQDMQDTIADAEHLAKTI